MSTTPLRGIKVVEFSHMIMGPSAGLILADLGAEAIKVETIGGDKTRRLKGAGAGYFPMFNRNKKSICLDLKSDRGATLAKKLITDADIFIENMRPGALDKLGFGYDALSKENAALIYCSEKGFLSGPYEQRTALDEIAQMMGGLAYMTGPPGRPLRAGSSVVDITGGMFGVIGVLSALTERARTGKGCHVTASLFETTVFLVGQHMAQKAVTGMAAKPMPARTSAWAIYDVFDTSDDDKIFVGVVSDTQWPIFCRTFEFSDWLEDTSLRDNSARVNRRDEIIPVVREKFGSMIKTELMTRLEKAGLPFAPIARPEDLFDDPHLAQSGGLLELTLPNGAETQLPALPVEFDGERQQKADNPPAAGAHTISLLNDLSLSSAEIHELLSENVIGIAT